jgi:hypothetical protein
MLTGFQGPLLSYGLMRALSAALGGPIPDPNQDAGPSILYGGFGYPDERVLYQDQSSGKTGVIPQLLAQAHIQSANVIPSAGGTAKIAALANVNSGTAMTLVTTNTVASASNIPIVPFSGAWQGQPAVTAPMVLDFGFAFVTGTAGSNSWLVADSTQFTVGMPLVISGAGSSATQPLLTWVASIVDATHITTNDNCITAATAHPVGAGNLWTPREGSLNLYPTAHVPFRASGVGTFLDPSQGLARCVSVTGGTSAVGSASGILISGWDVYWQPMSELIVAPAAASTTYGNKAFKAIASAVPQFSEAHNYSVGTGDTFGFAFRANVWEDTNCAWAALTMTAATGFTAAVTTTPATTTTGDVRGTVQTSAAGNGTGIGSTASNGTVSSLARTGNRLLLSQMPGHGALLIGTPLASAYAYGVTQA